MIDQMTHADNGTRIDSDLHTIDAAYLVSHGLTALQAREVLGGHELLTLTEAHERWTLLRPQREVAQ